MSDESSPVENSNGSQLLENTEVPPSSSVESGSSGSPPDSQDVVLTLPVEDTPHPPVPSNEGDPPLPATTTYVPTSQANSAATFSSCAFPATHEPQHPLPPISSLRTDYQPPKLSTDHPQTQSTPMYPPDCFSYLPDFSDLCQENYNFWQPFFDAPPSHSTTNQNATSVASGGNLAELDYLLERAGLYQGVDMSRNPWDELNNDGVGAPVLCQNPVDPLGARNLFASLNPPPQPVMNPSTLSYSTPPYSYAHYPTSLNPVSTAAYPPAHIRMPSTYSEFLYGQEEPSRLHAVTHSASQSSGDVGNYAVKILHRFEPQGLKREADGLRPSPKRMHYPEDLSKKAEDPRFRQELTIAQPRKPPLSQQAQPTLTTMRNMEGNPVVVCTYPVTYSYPTQTTRSQPVFLQVRAPPEKMTPTYATKTVKELLLQERGYESQPRMAMAPTGNQAQVSASTRMAVPTYWRLPSLYPVHPETPMTSSPKETPVLGNIWTVQVPGSTGKPLSMESALAGFRVKPGSTVTNVYPIPSKVASPKVRRPRKEMHVPRLEAPRMEALRAALLGESPEPSKMVESPKPSRIPPFREGKVDAKLHRPRHYEIERLQIGNFQVDGTLSEQGRPVNKLKVLFTKRRFVYEFQLQTQKTMCCVQVPFSSISAIELEDNRIRILLNRQPIMYLGVRNQRPGVVAVLNVYDTSRPIDITNGDIKRSPLHKITLVKHQAIKLKEYLWHFDERFQTLTEMRIPEYVPLKLLPPPELESVGYDFVMPDEPTSPKTTLTRTRVTRPPRRYGRVAEESAVSSSVGPSGCWVCSCRISCRSVRCSCVKAARKCSSGEGHCQCSNCDNPLNILEEVGVDPRLAVKDNCLVQNIYKIMYLKTYLDRTVKLECCGRIVTVLECIPGIVPCPNPQCSARLEYSWCRSSVINTRILSRNHCPICAKCCLRDQRHCLQCNRCFDFGGYRTRCPVCGSDEGWPANSPDPDLQPDDAGIQKDQQ